MTADTTDRTLLLGALALQMDFLTPEALAAALQAWSADRNRALAQVLQDQGVFSPERRALLEALVEQQLQGTSAATVREQDTDDLATRAPTACDVLPGANRFRILRPHAKGGLGQVSVALDEELRREVALKEIQEKCADDPAARARFLLEAEITGGLEHPGVVPVYGLGHYLDGRPYYAMRLIRGESFREAIARLHKDTAGAARWLPELHHLVRRLLDACNAVAYVHSRGVLHRDLKPGNILLGPYGETLVVDWGLARTFDAAAHSALPATDPQAAPALRPASPANLQPTRAGEVVGTFGFMSPEQASGLHHLLGPSSDVYSLGATLYNLLTGRPPFADKDPVAVAARNRSGQFEPPRAVNPLVPRPLEAICLKALARHPEDRYATATALAADLERWLGDEPVEAAPEPVGQRLGRWSRRHRPLVAAAVALLTTAVVALAASTVAIARAWEQTRVARDDAQAEQQHARKAQRLETEARKAAEGARREAEDARNQAEAERNRALQQKALAEEERKQARKEAARAEQAAHFLVSIFEGPIPDPLQLHEFLRPGRQKGEQLTAREVLDNGARRLEQLADQPLTQATLMGAMGSTYRNLAMYKKALPLLTRALDIRRRQLPADHLDVADSLFQLAELYHDQGNFNAALPLYRESLAVRQRQLPADDDRVLFGRFKLAWCLTEKGMYPEARQHFEAVLQARLKKHGENHRQVAVARIGLAALLLEQQPRDLLGAVSHVTKAVQVLLPKGSGSDDPAAGIAQLQQALFAKFLFHDNKSAEKILQKVLALGRRLVPADHPSLAFVLYELADSQAQQGKGDEADKNYRECLSIVRGSVGLEHPRVLTAVSNYAPFLARRGKYAEGKALYEEMLAAQRERFGADHEVLLNSLPPYIQFLRGYGDFAALAKAAHEFTALLRLHRRWFPDGLWLEGEALLRSGHYQEAEQRLRLALQAIAPNHLPWAVYSTTLAELHAAAGRPAEAERLVGEALRFFRGWRGPPQFEHLRALRLQTRLARRRGDLAEADRVSAEAVAFTRNRFQDFPPAVAGALEDRAGLLVEKNDPKKADPLFRQALALAGKHYWAGAREMAELRARLALARLAAGDRAGHRAACEALLKDFGKTSDPATAARVVRTCTLTPGIPAASLLDLAAAPVVFLKNEPACVFALAVALYRTGKYDEAARRLRAVPLTGTPLETHGDLLGAMCLHRLGKKGEAKGALAKAEARLDAVGKPSAAQPFAWDELVELKTLRREAEELLDGKGPG